MRGSKIIVSSEPRGRSQGVIVSGTPKPGTHMEIVPSTVDKSGIFTYRAVTRNDGAKGPIAILLEDELQGGLPTQAYVSGSYGKIYWPAAGEELNILMRDEPATGTANITNIGDPLEVDGATGMVQAVQTGGPTGAHESSPWTLMEHLGVDLTANTLVHAQYRGDQA